MISSPMFLASGFGVLVAAVLRRVLLLRNWVFLFVGGDFSADLLVRLAGRPLFQEDSRLLSLICFCFGPRSQVG